MARRPVHKSMVAVAFAIVALLLYSNPAAAQHEVKITTTLTAAVDPVTGEPIDTDGTGKAEFELIPEEGQICYEIEVQGIGAPTEPLGSGLGSAHIHFVADGEIAVKLDAEFEPKGDEFKAVGCVGVDEGLLSDIIDDPEAFYVNIHTVEFPGGELAGVL